jgi:hypothetical protein
MPETPGTEPDTGSHGEAGQASHTFAVTKTQADPAEETSNEEGA